METVEINFPGNASRAYKISIGEALLNSIGSLLDLSAYSRVVILTDMNVAPHWLRVLQTALGRESESIIIAPGEDKKSVETLGHIWQELTRFRADRKSVLLNLGGGVIGDLGGFAAASYMRGIDFIQIPTTLLAQVDASVGGKTAIDHAGVKNLVGSFAQPRAVLIDIATLSTLPSREFIAGFAEILKHGLVFDQSYFARASAKRPKDFSQNEVLGLVSDSVKIKAKVVEIDEKESGPRKLLNFGHTAGHAIESYSHVIGSPLLHGEAVGLGMHFEAKLSELSGRLSTAEFERVRGALVTCGLPVKLPFSAQFEQLLTLMRSDKKNTRGQIRWVLLSGIGSGCFDLEVDERYLDEAIHAVS